MYFMLTLKFPPHKGEEIAKKFMTVSQSDLARKGPKYVKQLNTFNVLKKNVKSYSLWKIDDDKVADGLRYIYKIVAQYLTIEGVKALIEPLMTMEDSLAIYGIKMD